jgi:hypothetical protein
MEAFKTMSGQENSMMPDQVAARCALVLETNNLRGGADAEAKAGTSLQRLVALLAKQKLPLAALAQVVVTHDGLSPATCEAVSRLAGRPVDFVRIDTATGYYDAKNVGFEATDARRCTHVVFADADCLPDDDWLLQMLLPFAQDDAPAVVAGRTSYAANVVGTALTTIDFMYFPNADHAGATSNFYANNVAFRREVFAQHSYQALDGVYRAHCQVLGMRLKAAGVPIRYAAQGPHRAPPARHARRGAQAALDARAGHLFAHAAPAAQLRVAALAVAGQERADRAAGRAVHAARVQREGAEPSRPAAAARAALARGRGADPRASRPSTCWARSRAASAGTPPGAPTPTRRRCRTTGPERRLSRFHALALSRSRRTTRHGHAHPLFPDRPPAGTGPRAFARGRLHAGQCRRLQPAAASSTSSPTRAAPSPRSAAPATTATASRSTTPTPAPRSTPPRTPSASPTRAATQRRPSSATCCCKAPASRAAASACR